MYKRFELHNHSTESDGSIPISGLVDYMAQNAVDVFAITDHNTISGHKKIEAYLKEKKYPLECIYGMEYTTYYGHILCFNLYDYISWENIDKNHAERLFAELKKAGALVGIAHPFSLGAPLAQGCRWEMDIHDYTCLDFIEIVNNPEPMHGTNDQGIAWWERLCLKGMKIAMSAGMDLHNKADFAGRFAVYIDVQNGESGADALKRAIQTQQTHVTKGPVLETSVSGNTLHSRITDCVKPGFALESVPFWTLEHTTISGTRVQKLERGAHEAVLPLSEFSNAPVIITKLYAGEKKLDNLTAVAPVIYRKSKNSV